MSIEYVTGDATEPIGDDHKIIAHVCNDGGAWGAGFVIALSRKWAAPEQEYREWATSGDHFQLAETQFVPVKDDWLWVANMVAQHSFVSAQNPVALRYDALEDCLNQVADFSKAVGDASVHMPRIGCGLAGGDWDEVEAIIDWTLTRHSIDVVVYDLA